MGKEQETVDALIDAVHEKDVQDRVKKEQRLLDAAESLTNGHAGDLKVMGEVLYGLAEVSTTHAEISRKILNVLPLLQSKVECELVHGKAKMKKTIGFNLPTCSTILVIFFTILQTTAKINNWW